MSPFTNIGNVPFDLNIFASMFPATKFTGEKARRLEAAGTIIRLKQGLYVASPDETGKALNRNLIANHLYGPSYRNTRKPVFSEMNNNNITSYSTLY